MSRIRPRRQRRGSSVFWWAVIGLLAGLGAALYATWVVWPVQYLETDPSDLLPERKALWAEMASDAYALTGDLQTARQRLESLGLEDPGAFVAEVAEARLQEGAALDHIRAMARLAEALGGVTARLMVYIATPAPTATPTPLPTATAKPTSTLTAATPSPTATHSASSQLFRLRSKITRCREGEGPDLIAVYAEDRKGVGIPGIRVEVSWAGGSEVLYTGLKPYIDPGYADYVMEPDIAYSVTVGSEGSEFADGITVLSSECPEIEGSYHHEWVIRFERP